MSEISRRTLLAGAAATAATAAFGTVLIYLPKAAEASTVDDQVALFVSLSMVLTGIGKSELAPNVDPFNLKTTYFGRAQKAKPEAFNRMLQIFKENQSDPTVGNMIFSNPDADTRILASSILLAWYLGAWYEPDALADRHKLAVQNRSPL